MAKSWKRELTTIIALPWFVMMLRCIWADATTIGALKDLVIGLSYPMGSLVVLVFGGHDLLERWRPRVREDGR